MTSEEPRTVDALASHLRDFARRRDWEQFHTPKNLAMALAGETGELVAELQWLTDAEIAGYLADPVRRARLEDEVADVASYLLRFADVCGIDLSAAVLAKISRNESRYPVDESRGSARKYSELRPPRE